jgi:hypothetical protein
MSRRKSPNIPSLLGLGRPRSQPRSQPRRTLTYGIYSDSGSESDGSEKEPTIIPVAEPQSEVDLTDAFKYVSISPTRYVSFLLACIVAFHTRIVTQTIRNLLRPRPNPLEARQVEETVAAIRLHAKHHDPYEDWEKQTIDEMHSYVHPACLSILIRPMEFYRQRTARKIQSSTLHSLHTHQSTSQSRALTHQSTTFAAQHACIS